MPGSNTITAYIGTYTRRESFVNGKADRLSLVGHESTQGMGPRDFSIDPSGALLLVANQDTDTVVTFWIDHDSGKLTATGHVAHVPTPVCLQLVGA